VYVLGGVLFAAPFDERRPQVIGRAVPVVEGIMRGGFANTSAHYSVSGSGSLVFVPGPVSTSGALREIVRMNRKGGRRAVAIATERLFFASRLTEWSRAGVRHRRRERGDRLAL
jgi:hypothetical protein